MKMLTDKDIPRWYGLEIDRNSNFPIIYVRKDLILELVEIHSDLIALYAKSSSVDLERFPYNPPDSPHFGYGDRLLKIDEDETYFYYLIRIPVISRILDELCPKCSGVFDDNISHCFECGNTRSKKELDFSTANATKASLAFLLNRINLPPDIDTETEEKQVLTVRTDILTGGSRIQHPVDGIFSPTLIEFLLSIER